MMKSHLNSWKDDQEYLESEDEEASDDENDDHGDADASISADVGL